MATVAGILATARSQDGVTERPAGSNITRYGAEYGMNGTAWCSIFVWWVFAMNGIDLKREVSRGYADCDTALDGYRRRGWVVPERSARPGDVVFYDMSRVDGSGADHTGIISAVTRVGVMAWEGNTSSKGSQTNGGAVLHKTRPWVAVKAVCRIPMLGADLTPPPPAPPTPAPWPTPAPTPTAEDDMVIYIQHDGTVARVTDTTIRPYATEAQYQLDLWLDVQAKRDVTVRPVDAGQWALFHQNRSLVGTNP